MRSFHQYIPICICFLVIAALATAVYVAIQYQNPIDMPTAFFDESVSTSNGYKVRLVYPDSPEKGVIFFLADDLAAKITTHYAKQFAELSYYVVVLDVQDFLTVATGSSSECINVAQKLQDIQNSLGDRINSNSQVLPILVGDNEGAALVYAALAQAKDHSFHAGISINFTAQLHNGADLCSAQEFLRSNADGTLNLAPVKHLSSTWYVFDEDNKNQSLANRQFTDQISNAKLTTHTEAGVSLISDVTQVLGWLDPRLSDQLSSDDTEGDLPIKEVTSEFDNHSQAMAIIVTGDGGWAEIDKSIANTLAKHGIPTVALDSLSYFWKKKTPQETAIAVEKIMTTYLAKWQKSKVILIGYSFGADVLPFIANQLTAKSRDLVALIVLLGIGDTATFEFHLSSWMDADNGEGRLLVLPEIKKMSWAKSICIYGTSDKEANCTALDVPGVKVIGMRGSHHFDEQYDAIVEHILENISGQK